MSWTKTGGKSKRRSREGKEKR